LGKLTVVGRQSAVVLRRAVGLALIVGLLVSAVVFYRTAPTFPRSATATTTGSPQLTTPVPTARASASPSPTGSPRSTHTTSPTDMRLPKGPGTTQPGILLMASPLRDGSFDVAEIVLLATPTSSVWLGPPQLTLAGSRFTKAKPVASQVQMSADNQPVLVPGGRVSQRTQPALVVPAKRIELRYNLSGITIRSIPSRAGRALTAISPLVDGVSKSLPVAFMVSGSTVLNIECPVLPLRERACSAGRVPQLRVKRNLPRSSALIIVQFDLPRPQ
jgi:hypothetical protein